MYRILYINDISIKIPFFRSVNFYLEHVFQTDDPLT